MLDKLELLLLLAKERHFGRAAEAAGVSQPTFSSAVKSLERSLGTALVERGSRFRGFTTEGDGPGASSATPARCARSCSL